MRRTPIQKSAVSKKDSTETILKDFMARGYLPAELPFCFTSGELARISSQIGNLEEIKNWEKKAQPTDSIPLSVPGRGLTRRALSIPNPISQYCLTKEIAQAWETIEEHCLKSKISFSRLRRPGAERALWNLRRGDPSNGGYDETVWLTKELAQKRLELGATSSHVLYADITNFYDSIYTHSIPWALHGKAVAKKDRSSKLLGNRLDKAVRHCNHGQTKGIPVGPDTSRVISEIIAVACDRELQKNLSKRKTSGLEGIRWVDDYHLYFQNASSRDKALGVLIESLEEYELALNHRKTRSILAGDELIEGEWVRSLRRFPFRHRPLAQFYDILGFCDFVSTCAQRHPGDSVVLYASKILWSLRTSLNEENLTSILAAIWRMTHLDPRVVPVACRHTQELLAVVQFPRLKSLVESMVEFHLGTFVEKRWALETCWLLWLCLQIKLTPPTALIAKLEAFDHPLVALLAMKLEEASLVRRKLADEDWKASVHDSESLRGPRWMLAYEVRRSGKLKRPMESEFFDLLKQKRVRFVK